MLKCRGYGRLLWIIVATVLGVAAITYGALRCIEAGRFLAAAVTVPGQVLGYERDCPADAEPRWLFYPVVAFSDRGGTPVQAVSRHGVAGKHYSPGSPVVVRYLASSPQAPSVRTPREWWTPALVAGFVGLLLLAPALRALLRRLRAPQLPQPAD